jgi:hypothetical protein
MLAIRAIVFTILVPGMLRIYAASMMLRGRGTPAMLFTKPLRFLVGEEPKALIQSALSSRLCGILRARSSLVGPRAKITVNVSR